MCEGASIAKIALAFREHLTEFSLLKVRGFSEFLLAVSVDAFIALRAVRVEEVGTDLSLVEARI